MGTFGAYMSNMNKELEHEAAQLHAEVKQQQAEIERLKTELADEVASSGQVNSELRNEIKRLQKQVAEMRSFLPTAWTEGDDWVELEEE